MGGGMSVSSRDLDKQHDQTVVNFVYRLTEAVRIMMAGLEPDPDEITRLLACIPAMKVATRNLERSLPELGPIFERMQQRLIDLLEEQEERFEAGCLSLDGGRRTRARAREGSPALKMRANMRPLLAPFSCRKAT